ncbi:MAG: lipoprotein signal peptidase [Bacteroidetes bacterium]|nr:MAG: lipoprotein signal peptidase [Bacteroidota bacterium]
MKKPHKYFLIAFLVIAVDQITKLIVKLNMELREEIRVIDDFFKIHFIENKGAAFGLTVANIFNSFGGNMSEETSKLILSIFSIIAVVFIGYFLYKLADHRSPLPYFVALIFGGALGNIIDRTFYGVWFASINEYEGGLFHGRVVDMFYFDIWYGTLPNWIPFIGGELYSLWPIFNVADAAISVGIVTILIFQGKFCKMDAAARKADPSSSSPASSEDAKKPEENSGSATIASEHT